MRIEHTALVAKIWHVLTSVERRGVVGLMGLITIGILLETLGVSLVVPAIIVMTQDDIAGTYPAAKPLLDAIGNPPQQILVMWGLTTLVLVFLFKSLYLAVLALIQTRFLFNIRIRISEQLYTTYLSQPWTFHLQRNSSTLIRNILSETQQLIQSALTPIMRIVTELLLLIGLLTILLIAEPVGAIVIALLLGVASLVFYSLVRKPVSRWGAIRQYHEGLRLQHLQQGLDGVKVVKLLGREEQFAQQYEVHNRAATRMVRNQSVLNQMPRLWLEFLAVVGLAALVGTMLYRGSSLEAVLPTLALFAAVAFRMMPSANKLVGAFQQLRFAAPAVGALYQELRLPSATKPPSPRESTAALESKISFDQVSFSYPGSARSAVSKASLEVRRGESVGLIGPSGSGKSTLVDLFLGILEPSSGMICQDGTDIYSGLRAWQNQLGYVPQSIYLTDDTLRRNIAFGLAEDVIDDRAVRRAIEAAQLGEFVASLPDGIDTLVGEHGVRLSGGQRQRIGIARALYHDPQVLVLDEATSALDNATEREVMKAIVALHGTKTVLIVAHRMTTVSGCDRIYRLEQGIIVQEGPAKEVLASPEIHLVNDRDIQQNRS